MIAEVPITKKKKKFDSGGTTKICMLLFGVREREKA